MTKAADRETIAACFVRDGRDREAMMAKWCIGIDLGGTFIKFCAMDDARRPTETFQLATPDSSDGVIEQMAAGAEQAIERHRLSRDDVLGVGIGSPGPMKISEGVVLSMPNVANMENVPLRKLVCDRLGLPGVLENDANAAAYAEYVVGAGKDRGDMVMLTLGTGVGSGIIVDGRLIHGSHEIGGELGHMIIVPDGEECGCGQRGCLERYCSAAYVAQFAVRQIEEGGRDSSLKAVLAEKGTIDAKDVNEARKAGDPLAEEVWNRGTYYLAIGCVNICRVFDPNEIVLAGGMTGAGEDLLAPVREHFRRLHWKATDIKTDIVVARLGNDAGAIGAAAVAWQALQQ